MNSLTARAIPVTLAVAALAAAGCGGSGSSGGGKPADKAGGMTAAKIGVGRALVTTNDRTVKPKKGALDRLADGTPAGAKPGTEALVAGIPDTGILDKLPQPAGLGAAKKVCAAASASPSSANVGRISRAVLCLLNAERVARGLNRLRTNGKLARAAIGHSRNMVARRYFAHNGADGNPLSRIRRAGYIPRVGIWTIGENLGFGTGALAAPGPMVTAWMNSPEHKANILTRGFKEIGIGIVARPAVGTGSGATFTTTFGGIRRR
jgi:uncharacterized protein YkwD